MTKEDSENEPTLQHILVVSAEGPHRWSGQFRDHLDVENYDWTLFCPGSSHCSGWQECTGDHTGYDPDDLDSVACDKYDEEVVIHGVAHEWKYGWGWTVPYVGCPVQASGTLGDDAHEILMTYGPGAYLVDDEWYDDTEVRLLATGLVGGLWLPPTGWIARAVAEREALLDCEDC